MTFRCEIPVRFADCDFARIVYYPRFLHYCHVTMEELFRQRVGVPYHVALQDEDVGYPTVRVEAEYRLPVPLGETIVMEVTVARLGNRSVDFVYTGRRKSDDQVAFVIRSRAVATSMARWQSRAMPEHHRAVFAALARPSDTLPE